MIRYGLTHYSHLVEHIELVCKVLGNGKNQSAEALILETIAVETNLGTLKDSTIGAGMGIAQFDKIPFYDIRDRIVKYRPKWVNLIKKSLGIDISLVKWEDLRYNPLLSVIFCRLFYKLKPEEIPTTTEDRAEYWKNFYNTPAGKGTTQHYIRSVEQMEEFKAKLL